jgi:hypothetical protein
MKVKALVLMVLLSASSFAQDTAFKFSKEGLTDFVVGTFDGSAKDIYKWTLAWANENNKRPNAVQQTVENEKVVFQGIKENFLCSKAGGTNVCSTALYTIEISIKEGKYKFDVTGLVLKDKSGKGTQVNLSDFSEYYDKDGNLKKYMNDVPATYEALFNDLNKNLLTYLDKKKKAENW